MTMSDMSVQEEGIVEELLVYLDIHQEPKDFLSSLRKGIDQDGIPASENLALKSGQLALGVPNRFLSIINKLKSFQSESLKPLIYVMDRVKDDPTIAPLLEGVAIADETTLKQTTTMDTPSEILKRSGSASSTFLNTTPAKSGFKLPRRNSLHFTPKRSIGTTALAAESSGEARTPSSVHAPILKSATPFFRDSVDPELTVDCTSLKSIRLNEIPPKEQELLVIQDLLYLIMVIIFH